MKVISYKRLIGNTLTDLGWVAWFTFWMIYAATSRNGGYLIVYWGFWMCALVFLVKNVRRLWWLYTGNYTIRTVDSTDDSNDDSNGA